MRDSCVPSHSTVGDAGLDVALFEHVNSCFRHPHFGDVEQITQTEMRLPVISRGSQYEILLNVAVVFLFFLSLMSGCELFAPCCVCIAHASRRPRLLILFCHYCILSCVTETESVTVACDNCLSCHVSCRLTWTCTCEDVRFLFPFHPGKARIGILVSPDPSEGKLQRFAGQAVVANDEPRKPRKTAHTVPCGPCISISHVSM